MIDDRYDIGEALARAGPGGEDVVLAAAGREDTLDLMLVKTKGPIVGIGTILLAEDPERLGVERTILNELGQGRPLLEGGVELDQWLGPEEAGVELVVYSPPYQLVTDRDETLDIVGVFLDDPVAKLEYIHDFLIDILG